MRHCGASQKFLCAILKNDAPWRTWRTPELSLAISLGFFPGVTVHYFLRDLALVVRAAGGSATRGGGGISPDG